MTEPESQNQATTVRYQVAGMDCSSCAGKIESAARGTPGVENVKVSMASQVMTLNVHTPAAIPGVERAVTALGYKLNRLESESTSVSTGHPDDDDLPKDLSHLTAAYRHALWIVAVLNLSYGVIEILGGFLSGSQALKADAMDFLGDGTITCLGILAISWRPTWRSRAALLQGLFLGMLGVGVLVGTAYRVLVVNLPEAELMGLFGLIALAVNITAAFVLMRHRHGDANVRAVWLFSRNDAIGNVAVVIAAVLVAWTGTRWPDLIVAAIIAVLFLQSAWVIARDARYELRETRMSSHRQTSVS